MNFKDTQSLRQSIRGSLVSFFIAAASVMMPHTGGASQLSESPKRDVAETPGLAKTSQGPAEINVDPFIQVVVEACKKSDLILIGDTDHKSNALLSIMATEAFSSALAQCGIGKEFVEIPVSFRKTAEAFQNRQLTQEKLAEAIDYDRTNFHNMSNDMFEKSKSLEVDHIVNLTKKGVQYIPSDSQNGADALWLYAVAHHTLIDLMSHHLPESDQHNFQLFMANRENEIPANELPTFQERLNAATQTKDVQDLSLWIAQHQAEFQAARAERFNDKDLVDRIQKDLKSGEKAVIIYGANHMKSEQGMSALFAAAYRVTRIDIFENAQDVSYNEGDAKPDYAFALRDNKIFTIQPKQATSQP